MKILFSEIPIAYLELISTELTFSMSSSKDPLSPKPKDYHTKKAK